jgi:hypothetical protein
MAQWWKPARPGPERAAPPAVPHVTVQIVTRDGRTYVEAVAQIGDGHVTARAPHEECLFHGVKVEAAAEIATQSAIKQAWLLLAGARAGHTDGSEG